jgi:REP element-mobilizing transposase RayT
MRLGRQLELTLSAPRRWGGRRAGAGRKPAGERAGLPHAARPAIAARHPAHVTLRVRAGLPSLRSPRLVRAFERSLAEACERGDFRVVQYSLQSNHVHLVVEAAHRTALARGMIAVGSRLARAVNRVFRRRGKVLADRYHVRALKTPREVWNALRYVLLNARRHARRLAGAVVLDPASSARWFDGWRPLRGEGRSGVAVGPSPVARARTWLLAFGWRRHGLVDPSDVPGPG